MTNQVAVKKGHPATQERVIDLISWRLNIPSSQIHPYTHLKDDLYLDAIDILLLIIELESRFNVFLTPEEVEAIETVQDASFIFQQSAA
jgi:acyl carrier protein